MNRNNLIIGAIILLILAGGLGFWIGRTVSFSTLTSGMIRQEKQDTAANLLTGGNAVAVNDQPPGLTVAVSFVTLAKDGWVVIHEDRDGKPGNILGAQRFNAGERQSGTVDLLRATETSKVYYAMLHGDDGDHLFDHAKDLPLTDPQGNIIMMRFVASAQPE